MENQVELIKGWKRVDTQPREACYTKTYVKIQVALIEPYV